MAAETRQAIANEIKPRHWLWWLGGFVVLIGMVLAVAAWQKSRPITYIRYVSPPFSDGTRETFLYPAGLGEPLAHSYSAPGPGGKTYTVQYVFVMRSLGPVERIAFRIPFLRGMIHPDEFEFVHLHRTDNLMTHASVPVGRLVTSDDGRYLRSEDTQTAPNGAEHNLTLVDRKSHLRYVFSHDCNGVETRRRFERDDAKIIASFQILSPGMAPPRP